MLAGSIAALTAACGDRAGFRMARLGYDMLFGDAVPNPLSRAQVEAFPYAMLEVRLGKTVVADLVLVRRVGADLQWQSQDRKVIETRSGRLVKTSGLPTDIVRTEFLDEDPVARGLQGLTGATEIKRIVDFSQKGKYGRVVESRLEVVGDDPITILELTYPTRLVRESNRIEAERWEFENLFWFDPSTGVVWRSEQHVGPDFPPLRISLLKPPAANV